MSTSSLEHKTVRPGSLLGYSYYYSGRRSTGTSKKGAKKAVAIKNRHTYRGKLFLLLVLVAVATLLVRSNDHANVAKTSTPPKVTKTISTTSSSAQRVQSTPPTTSHPAASVVTPAPVNNCAGNSLDQAVIVSISQRHLWACQQNTTVYNSPVVTGISYLSADLTPIGTYHVYGKQTDTTLAGSDSTGSWNDFVYYWMPFLRNQYGSYGFHDATWRASSDFGNISPDSSNASHGCVELPLSTAKWLYEWIDIGATVTINS